MQAGKAGDLSRQYTNTELLTKGLNNRVRSKVEEKEKYRGPVLALFQFG